MNDPVQFFETEIKGFVGADEVIVVDHGSNAIYIALRALGLEKGDVVITTPFPFFNNLQT